ncbi:MAG: hypothetical protein MZW92_30600 [Comamonadaceae bacterium]|nr:hypothetical protein [Comamonadaceae bacterium]
MLLGDDLPLLLRFSAEIDPAEGDLLQVACARSSKASSSSAATRRTARRETSTWLKPAPPAPGVRRPWLHRPRNASGEIGSLLLGVHDEAGRLVHAGGVGTGWNARTARELHQRLTPLRADAPPFADGARAPGRWRPARGAGAEHRVRSDCVVEVESSPNGRPPGTCATPCSSVCARTSRRATSSASGRWSSTPSPRPPPRPRPRAARAPPTRLC